MARNLTNLKLTNENVPKSFIEKKKFNVYNIILYLRI